MEKVSHIPVLREEALRYWVHDPRGLYVDLTLGMGGHSEALLRAYPEARVLGLDWDAESLAMAVKRLEPFGARFSAVHQNFSRAGEALRRQGIEKADGFLFDLGYSSFQMLESGRGLAYQKEEALDMRLSKDFISLTAGALLAGMNEESLAAILVENAEMAPGQARWAAKSLMAARARKPLATTSDLKEALGIGNRKLLSRIFQALRIAVNAERVNLKTLLDSIWTFIVPGGRVVGISFHSLEDRMIKQAFVHHAASGAVKILTKKPVMAQPEELRLNPKARSAKLRAAEAMQ